MPTYDVCIYPDNCVHVVVDAVNRGEAEQKAMTVFEAELDEHIAYVKRGRWLVQDVTWVRGEDDDAETE